MKQVINALDPGRAVTQALMRPDSNGDITGATCTVVDVFGANYRTEEVLRAWHYRRRARGWSPSRLPTRHCGIR